MEKNNQKSNKSTTSPGASGGFGRKRGHGGMGGLKGPVEKPKNFKATMAALIKYLKPFRISIIIVLVFAVISTGFTIIGPKILGNVTNNIVAGYLNHMIDYGAILKLIELLIGLYLLSALFSYIQGWIMSGVSQKVTFNLRRDISLKINRLPLSYFDNRTHGEVLSRVTNDVDTVSQTLNQSLIQIVTAITSIIGILIMMLTISWQMTLVAIIILPISLGLINLVVGKSQKYFSKQQVSLGKINGHIEEMFSGHTIMKAFNGEKKSIATFHAINNELYDGAWKSHFFSGLLMPIMTFIGNLGYVAVAVLGGWLAINGKIKIGDIQAFIQYMNQFTQPITQTANIANVLQSTAAAAERVFEFLAEKDEITETAFPVLLPNIKGAVEFDNVVFGYSPDKTIIHGFTTSVKPGQRVAIVGPTGAGKTTIVNLLMRFYDVNSGAIKIDGIDIRDMKRADLRALFSMVLQDTWLFTGTIEDNIAYGKSKASHEEVVAASKAAHSDHFIRALPGSYNMKLNEETDNISQGEKQLLTIARAMLANAPMLILDEATSSVDTRTELLIQKAMEKLMKGRTSFVIAHRLSTIKNSDLILVMRDGNIVEQGNHKQLLSQNGFYTSLYNSQFAKI